jgi:hypothetical protein
VRTERRWSTMMIKAVPRAALIMVLAATLSDCGIS